MTDLPSLRRIFVPSMLTGVAALISIGCAGNPKYKSAKIGDDRLATPPHNLSPAEYPFDDDGRYRKDWVANPSSAKRSRRSAPPQQMASNNYQAPPPPPSNYAPPPTISTPGPSAPSYSPPPPPRPDPKPTPPPAAAKPAKYHTVVKGDTLYSISRKFSVTVAQLKSTNGLTSDTIRIGQTLRVP
ncbi:MAG: LysM peptidoglycan-binding domain-containing protein [Verrucomicrobiae bacterium]|nr:LysM peptidoglycan-binding domain-containing protein [Verrucomicrobiae bacterium]MCB1088001.1 LysM peptidoglycan-binding domain-containing protein [Verrucomicrobiae bacterium]